MSYAAYLKDLLRPMRVYALDGTMNGAELEGIGAALDAVWAQMEHIQREMNIETAQDGGLDAVEGLFSRRPMARSGRDRRAALSALLRVGGDSFTPSAINDNLKGCGLNAVAEEIAGPQAVRVWFPGVPGIPDGFSEIRKIIEDILPCHLKIEYLFWYMTWMLLEARFAAWQDIEAAGYDWNEFERLAE